MLKHLSIRNYALIKQLELDPSANLNVITGETGAGKSILLGAIGLLMGNRADSKVLWDEDEKCITEGTFDIRGYRLKPIFKSADLDYDDLTVIRREISPGGKSRAFINDTPVTLDVMKKIGSLLMDIHSQHETLQLGNQVFQLQLIDAFAENGKLMEVYDECWTSYLQAKHDFEKLSAEAETLRQEADYTNFQLDELDKAGLEENEQGSLESEVKIMEHAEEIKTRFNSVLELLSRSEYSSRSSLADARNNVQHLATFSPAYNTLFERLNSVIIELDDILNEIENEESKVDFDPQRAEFVKERLNTMYRLLKKHRTNDLKELLVIQEDLRRKSRLTSNLDGELANARATFEQAEKKLVQAGNKLSESRKKVIASLCKKITKLLDELGIPNATLQIDIQPIAPSPGGADKVDILFSANKGIAARQLSQVASGGEFSRLMFCIKYVMAEKKSMPTLVLDEIDTGVSGEIAMKLGGLMKSMSKEHQLITITHLPQIAAKGDSHYFVFKDNSSKKTVSSIRELKNDERIEEIAKMIGGAKPSKVALENAQELLAE
jgi:DNA repair protein RecN (Recombination protein N)